MAHEHPVKLQPDRLILGPVANRLGIPGLLIGIIALAIAAWLGTGNDQLRSHFFHSYLFAFCFFMAITLGAQAFVLIHHLTRAGWSVSIRRLAEGLSMNMFLMVILVLPLLAGTHILFKWFDPNVVHIDTELREKSGYLNHTFFYIRLALYFLVWCFLAWFYRNRSLAQDRTGDPRQTVILEKLACPAIIVFGYALTAFAFDWIMSLDSHWFSTIFGVYVFAGCMLSCYSTLVLLSLTLKKQGLIGKAINHDHYHDLGKWMFAFTFFWGYIGFAQYMLIWYSNIPEETQFFIPRQIGIWASLSLVLLVIHLLIPFPGLLSRHVKRRNPVIAFWAVWSLCACMFDMYYLVMPNEWMNKIPTEVGNRLMPLPNALPLLIDSRHNIYALKAAHASFMQQIMFPFEAKNLFITALCVVGIGGLYVFSTMLALKRNSLVPLQDPRLQESLAFENM